MRTNALVPLQPAASTRRCRPRLHLPYLALTVILALTLIEGDVSEEEQNPEEGD